MSAPDHWVTLCFLGQGLGWGRARLLAVSVITAAGHVVLSIVVGIAVGVVGMVFAKNITGLATLIIGALMLAAGASYATKTLLSEEQEDYRKEAEEDGRRIEDGAGRGLKYFAVLGGALSPDLTVLPVFVLVAPDGLVPLAYTAAVFAVASILSLLLFVAVGTMGLSKVFERIPPKYNDALVGVVIAIVGLYVLLGG